MKTTTNQKGMSLLGLILVKLVLLWFHEGSYSLISSPNSFYFFPTFSFSHSRFLFFICPQKFFKFDGESNLSNFSTSWKLNPLDFLIPGNSSTSWLFIM